ncbi:conserved protein of unknown function (plasmid) [Cupriavidus taiwanensis]|uniref:Uncharacterized protein n=1 Tax=Cupriavidus taiwanensis TaxID=164546 RepID=A0A375HFH2_9BURK|nr:conserved hypothetical protein [Cupriavidus taiwanensis]SOZ88949.1 conserved hypothetical protein [Cupriavidus taiwanensis]SOZ95830.1 conserved hypothetical protein [Cupriavidus taiwanensis]SPA35296.1 conserved hypothetical protein [Cupriavidus taiwanensis]SPA52536.1 conserved hypothetical protein [Cupriavidus taiwanensis]
MPTMDTNGACHLSESATGRDWLPDHRLLNSLRDIFYPVGQQSKGRLTQPSQRIQRSRLQGYASLFLRIAFAVGHQRQHAGCPSRNRIGLIQQIQ